MRKHTKIIVLSVILLVIIALITLAMIYDVDFGIFKNLSISGIQEKRLNVENLVAEQDKEKINNLNAKDNLQSAKDSFDVAKQKFDQIDDSTIATVQQATMDEKYFIEYLWIVLGNYATANNLKVNVVTPGSTVGSSGSGEQSNSALTAISNGIKIVVEGRYANVADFVFDIENDKSLKFKLDNISMTYTKDNKIQATFSVLSLAVLK